MKISIKENPVKRGDSFIGDYPSKITEQSGIRCLLFWKLEAKRITGHNGRNKCRYKLPSQSGTRKILTIVINTSFDHQTNLSCQRTHRPSPNFTPPLLFVPVLSPLKIKASETLKKRKIHWIAIWSFERNNEVRLFHSFVPKLRLTS